MAIILLDGSEHLTHGHMVLVLGETIWWQECEAERGVLIGQNGEGLGEEGKKETVIPSICPSDLHLPSRFQLPEISKPPKIASPAGDQTFKPRVWGRHDCYTDHNRCTDMVRLLIHFLSSNTEETLQVNLA